MDKYEGLRLKNQLCFPLYSVSNLIIRNYKPLLDKLDLTYTQYIVMMVLWEKEVVAEKELSEDLFLKSNTLAPLLQKLKEKGYVDINKDNKDGRYIKISLTKKGKALKEKAVDVPPSIVKTLNLSADEMMYLYKILYKIMEANNDEKL